MKKKSFTPKKEFLTVGVRLTLKEYEKLQEILRKEDRTFSQWARAMIEKRYNPIQKHYAVPINTENCPTVNFDYMKQENKK